ncbi:hypothetical protein CONCODRAFT_169829, partial [Conidiobolus coronatus NRRL 28638]
MSSEIKYKIFSENLRHPFYVLDDPAGNRLFFSRHNWTDCRLIMNNQDLVKIDVTKSQPLTIALNFAFKTSLDNIVFSVPNPNKFKVKGSYYDNKLKEINWKWKTSGPWSTKFTLIDKKNKGKELAKIEDFTLGKGLDLKTELTGSITISEEVPSEFHNLIIVSGCLVFKEMQELSTYKLTTFNEMEFASSGVNVLFVTN